MAFLTNSNTFIYTMLFFFIKCLWLSLISLTSVDYFFNMLFSSTPLNPVFFILSTDQSLEVFPKHNGLAAISESFALNL